MEKFLPENNMTIYWAKKYVLGIMNCMLEQFIILR